MKQQEIVYETTPDNYHRTTRSPDHPTIGLFIVIQSPPNRDMLSCPLLSAAKYSRDPPISQMRRLSSFITTPSMRIDWLKVR